jgi:putative Ig domain-containing protein
MASLHGTPTTPGTYPFTVRATDSLGATTTRTYTVVVHLAGTRQYVVTITAPSPPPPPPPPPPVSQRIFFLRP